MGFNLHSSTMLLMNKSTIPLEQHLSTVKELQDQVSLLKEQVAWFQRQIFGQRSEKIISQDDSQLFFDMDFPDLPNPMKKPIAAHERNSRSSNSNKISFPEDLPIETTIIDLKEEQKKCPKTGQPLAKIGEDVTQRLAHRPGSYYIKETVRPKYAMPKGGEEKIIAAELPDSILTRCKADESLLADILVKKFSDHLPLYRQSEMRSREGVYISRQTLSKWVTKCGQALKPLFNELSNYVLSSKNVFIDEVPVDMLKPGKGKTHKAYMWVITGGKERDPFARIYNFRTDRRYGNASELIKDYSDGIVHSDKYGAYEQMACRKEFIWCPCWAHIRRMFIEGVGGDGNFTKLILRKIKYLFMYEKVAWGRSKEERLRIRQEKELPVIDELIKLVKDRLQNGSAVPKSAFKSALTYFMGLVPYLKNYTRHPFARLDNNVAERAVRPLALGRKNWLFLGSEEAGESAAVILSLVQTCKALKINPREYLEDVMRRIMSHSSQKLEELLPHNWSREIK